MILTAKVAGWTLLVLAVFAALVGLATASASAEPFTVIHDDGTYTMEFSDGRVVLQGDVPGGARDR